MIEQSDGEEFGESIRICYAIVGKALLVSLNERHLWKAIACEDHEFDEGQLEKMPEADSLMIDADPAMLEAFDRMDRGLVFDSRLAKLSWKAIPVLNEWRRRFPGQDPAVTHLSLFGVSVDCPGGKGYRWNEEHWTMESVVYGHVGSPRMAEKKRGLIKYGRMYSGIDFIDDGLRLRMHLGPGSGLPALPEPEVGEVIGRGVELAHYQTGRVLSYEGSDEFGSNDWKSEVLLTEKTPEGILVQISEPWASKEEKGTWTGRFLIDDKGIWQMGSKDEFSTTSFTQPPLDLPLELRVNGVHRYEATGESLYEEDGEREISVLRERGELRVLGLETIETKAGRFEDCVVVERFTEELDSDYFSSWTNKEWYHPGTGMVQTRDENGDGGVLVKKAQTD